MAERTARLYEAPESPLESLCGDFAGGGLGLLHPRSGHVILLDGEGEQVEASKEELEQRIRAGTEVSFQWWLAEDHDVYCRIRVRQGVRILELGMEGCDAAELAAVGSVLERRFLRNMPKSMGLVFDPEGTTEGYDWDRFFLDQELLDWRSVQMHPPKMLGVPRQCLERLEHVPMSAISAAHDLVLLSTQPD